MNFTALEKITDGEYQMQCETPGVIGNQYLGSMVPIEYIEGLETAKLTKVLIPGEDREDTEDLRTRYSTPLTHKLLAAMFKITSKNKCNSGRWKHKSNKGLECRYFPG